PRRPPHSAADRRAPALPAAPRSRGGYPKDVRAWISRQAGAGETLGPRPQPAPAGRSAPGPRAGDERGGTPPALALGAWLPGGEGPRLSLSETGPPAPAAPGPDRPLRRGGRGVCPARFRGVHRHLHRRAARDADVLRRPAQIQPRPP